MSTVHPFLPNMSRNIALAGKTVSAKGMNVRYDELGYAVQATNFRHKVFAGTANSIRAPSIDAVLGGEERSKYTGSAEDLAHFSNQDLAHVESWRQQVLSGEITARQAYAYLESLRKEYGYSGNADENEFVKLEQSRQSGVAMAEAGAVSGSQGVEAPIEASIPAEETPAAPQSETAASVQSRAAAAPQSETEQLQDAYQAQLRTQQEQQSLKDELNGMRVDSMLKSLGEQKKDELFDVLFEDVEAEEQDG